MSRSLPTPLWRVGPLTLKKFITVALGDWSALSRATHTLRGILRMFGLAPAVALLTELEQLAAKATTMGEGAAQQAGQASLAELGIAADYLLAALRSGRGAVLK